jgi:hypothetical protein
MVVREGAESNSKPRQEEDFLKKTGARGVSTPWELRHPAILLPQIFPKPPFLRIQHSSPPVLHLPHPNPFQNL